jgi:hypothetical protein
MINKCGAVGGMRIGWGVSKYLDKTAPMPLFYSLLIQFRNHFSQTVGLLERVISPSQGRYLHTGQHKQNERIHTPMP